MLIGAGALGFWLLEAPRLLFGMPLGEQILASLFQSVTARTAGFNTVDIGALAPGTHFLLILLMLVGGSPGSCAGGIKTTTLGVLLLAAHSRLRGRLNVNAFHRTLSPTTVRNTLSIAVGGFFVVVVGLFALLLTEAPASGGGQRARRLPQLPVRDHLGARHGGADHRRDAVPARRLAAAASWC